MEIIITVNGQKYTLEVDPKDSLLFILREKLGLTGTKNGCSQNHCGACTVIMDGDAVRSCHIRAKLLNGTNIITIEGISPRLPDDELHPIQQAFIKTTAIQCGFCTPGYIMELYGLYEKNPNVSEEEIKSKLEGHLCRCTGYEPIIDAAILAKELLKARNQLG
ncbi:MAG: (2Fe-2S)-binding protein [Candidatus Heimdallarchaeota archaeon]|nr:MAG: (2Fe-2S)-binding protein [Candidatus Heimdallarchaeota archaeon]